MTQWTPIGSGGQYTDPTGMATSGGSFEDAQTGNGFSSAAYCKPRKPHCNSCRDRWEVKMGYDQLASQQARINPKNQWKVHINAPIAIAVDDFLRKLAPPKLFPPKTKANRKEREQPRHKVRRYGPERYAWAVTAPVVCDETTHDCVDNNGGDGDMSFHLWDGVNPFSRQTAIKCEMPNDACT
jgi:hypothetical protein